MLPRQDGKEGERETKVVGEELGTPFKVKLVEEREKKKKKEWFIYLFIYLVPSFVFPMA